jgi:hypothetical protein
LKKNCSANSLFKQRRSCKNNDKMRRNVLHRKSNSNLSKKLHAEYKSYIRLYFIVIGFAVVAGTMIVLSYDSSRFGGALLATNSMEQMLHIQSDIEKDHRGVLSTFPKSGNLQKSHVHLKLDEISSESKASAQSAEDNEEETKIDFRDEIEEDRRQDLAQPNVSLHDGRKVIRSIFADAGIELDDATMLTLPTWNEVIRNIGDAPQIHGLKKCSKYRSLVPAVERNVACCGMFNSGTNLLMRLLKENCKIPERVAYYGWNDTFDRWGMGPGDAHGMRWQVPWGKHTAAKYRTEHLTDKSSNIPIDTVLPIVTIRNPYIWMSSMCKNPYTAKWPHPPKTCPNLVYNARNFTPRKLAVSYGGYEDTFDSLAHLWNGWYRQYWKEADYPLLIVRFEDLIFHARNVTTQICSCAGGVIRTDRPFFHIVKSAKIGPGHGKADERTDMVQAWIRYGKSPPIRGGFSRMDYKAARKFLDNELMNQFKYRHPSPI